MKAWPNKLFSQNKNDSESPFGWIKVYLAQRRIYLFIAVNRFYVWFFTQKVEGDERADETYATPI